MATYPQRRVPTLWRAFSSKGHSAQWLARHVTDRYVRQAQEESYRSRAAFKLKQLDAKFNFFKPKAVVVDLGCFAGGWSQVALERTGANTGRGAATVIGVDKVVMEPLENHHFVKGDIRDATTLKKVEALLSGRKADIVLADMAPQMSGSKADDHINCIELCREAAKFAELVLCRGGCFVTKIFTGVYSDKFRAELAGRYGKVKGMKPPASRDASCEFYIVCTGFHAGEPDVPGQPGAGHALGGSGSRGGGGGGGGGAAGQRRKDSDDASLRDWPQLPALKEKGATKTAPKPRGAARSPPAFDPDFGPEEDDEDERFAPLRPLLSSMGGPPPSLTRNHPGHDDDEDEEDDEGDDEEDHLGKGGPPDKDDWLPPAAPHLRRAEFGQAPVRLRPAPKSKETEQDDDVSSPSRRPAAAAAAPRARAEERGKDDETPSPRRALRAKQADSEEGPPRARGVLGEGDDDAPSPRRVLRARQVTTEEGSPRARGVRGEALRFDDEDQRENWVEKGDEDERQPPARRLSPTGGNKGGDQGNDGSGRSGGRGSGRRR